MSDLPPSLWAVIDRVYDSVKATNPSRAVVEGIAATLNTVYATGSFVVEPLYRSVNLRASISEDAVPPAGYVTVHVAYHVLEALGLRPRMVTTEAINTTGRDYTFNGVTRVNPFAR